jgi:zinc transport system permease protein
MFEIFQYSFMVRAFAAGIIIAAVAPVIGSFLVVRRYSLIADTLSHVALSGVAIGLLLGVQPLITTIAVTMVAALCIEWLRTRSAIPADAVLAMFLPGGLALSIVLISLAHGFNTNLFNFLFGSITTVTPGDVWLILTLGLVTIGTIAYFYKQFLYSSFDEESARVSGVPVEFLNTVLVLLTAITVSLSMRIVGILLIGALMVIPVTTAMLVARSFLSSIFIAVGFALVAVNFGLLLSYYYNLPAGGSIVLLSFLIFGIVAILKRRLV